jgi:hypothetical protein
MIKRPLETWMKLLKVKRNLLVLGIKYLKQDVAEVNAKVLKILNGNIRRNKYDL